MQTVSATRTGAKRNRRRHAHVSPPTHSCCLSPRYTRLGQRLAPGGFAAQKQLSTVFACYDFATPSRQSARLPSLMSLLQAAEKAKKRTPPCGGVLFLSYPNNFEPLHQPSKNPKTPKITVGHNIKNHMYLSQLSLISLSCFFIFLKPYIGK